MKSRLFECTIVVLACATATQAGNFYVSPQGADTNPGTKASPFRTIQKAADTMKPGDTCILRGGVYRETVRPKVSGQADKSIRFVAAPNEKVILKGTDPIQAEWKTYKGNIYQAQIDADANFAQLFVDGQMMVEARWPNMRFPDELWDRSKWAHAGKGSFHGKIVDAKLTETGIDWTGARAVLNAAHQFITWTRTVTKHTAGSDTFEYTPDLLPAIRYAHQKTNQWWEDDRYYLTGKLEALDAPGEWFLDTKTNTLYLWPLNDKHPASCQIEAKTRNYALEAHDLDYIELWGLHFFGATFLFENCNHCLIENCNLLYPTYARRISDPTSKEPWVEGTFVDGSHNTVRKCSLAYSPTAGLRMVGSHNVAEDNLIHDISWYGSLQHSPLSVGKKRGTDETGIGIVRHNTVYNLGNAGICYRGQSYIIEYNHVYNGGLACKDVALIYTGQPHCAGSIVRYNWVHGCHTEEGRGLGIRGDDQTRRLTVHHNVVWNCGRDGIIVKGDHNKVYNNTVLDIGTKPDPGNYVNLHTCTEPKKAWRNQYPLLEHQNANSEIFNNAALTITSHNLGYSFPSGPNVSNNYHDTDIKLMNPRKMDFRPKKDSPLIDAGREIPGFTDGFKGKAPDIGAYEFGGEYWKAGITWRPKKRPKKD